jgi:uncharacterized protein (TIGR03435 family)
MLRFASLLLASTAFAQPAFEVASVKQSVPVPPGENYRANLGSAFNGRVQVTNGTLADCIKFAYGLVSDDQLAGPAWIKSKEFRYDVDGRAPAGATRDQMLLMLRTLLDERFHLKMHTESRAFGHLVLTVAKEGSKMKEVPDDSPSNMTYAIGHITHSRAPMYTLALLLSRQMRQLVLDQTGLKGFYQVDLRWTPADAPEGTDTGPPIFKAIQEQLGLKLEARKDGVDVLVVDSAEKVPTAN